MTTKTIQTKKQIKAILYEVTRNPDGTLIYKPITSAIHLTVPMIAATLEMSKQTVYRHIDEGRLKAVRFGATVRVEAEEYAKWIESGRLAEYERPARARSRRGRN